MKRCVWVVVASASLIFSCADSGQTGSPDCAPVPLSCECDSLAGKSLVKGTVLAIDTGSVTLEVLQVLNPSRLLDDSDVHSTVVGVLALGTACARNAQVAPQVGDTVFAAFFPYSNRTPDAPRDVGEAVVEPWSDSIDLGNRNPLALPDALALTDLSTCYQRYPGPVTFRCNDTSSVTCALSNVPKKRSGSCWWSLSALLAGAAALGRRTRSLSRRS